MAEQDMRLRLVVRRHGLPELRLMWHVRLDSNPTIAKLLEQLNDHVPLESEHWGLEDYVVELHDADGTDFECLHYQLVRSVLKPDDRVFVRALDHDDRRRRRISGRLQISSDGRHLVDGVPFGRPSLRTPAARPPVHIPPRKRPRLTYTQQGDEVLGRGTRPQSDSPVLLLTDGEPDGDGHLPPRTWAVGDFEDVDSDTDDTDYNSGDAGLDSSADDSEFGEGKEIDDEIEDNGEDEGDEDEEELSQDLNQEARDLAVENSAMDGRGQNPPRMQSISLETLDKLTALRAAFPTAPIDVCEKVLAACSDNLETTYSVLSEGFGPQLSREAVLAWKPGSPHNGGAHSIQARAPSDLASSQGISGGAPTRNRHPRVQFPPEDASDKEDEGHNTDLWRKYDHAGFPPGTITSGTGLSHMASISASFGSNKTNGNSEATSTTLKAVTDEPMEEDDDTSSSGTSSDSSDTSSSGSSLDSDDTSSSGDSSAASDASDDASEEDSASEDSSAQSSSADSDDSDSDAERSDDCGGEPSRSASKAGLLQSSISSGSDTSDASDNESDSGPEEYPFQTTSGTAAKDEEYGGSNESSDETPDSESDSQSGGADPSSESEDASSEPDNTDVLAGKSAVTRQIKPQDGTFLLEPTKTDTRPVPVPPGAGKESTKRRNARRRAAKRAKRETQGAPTAPPTLEDLPTGDGHALDRAALFEAKRTALLAAIATGGIEVSHSGKSTLDRSPTGTDRAKRKRTQHGPISPHHDVNETDVEDGQTLGDDQEEPSLGEKRRRLDLGAGRRLVFGALGLRNPRNKKDEAELRVKLQTEAQSRASQPPSQFQSNTAGVVSIGDEEDLEAWRLKINYRAVECCHDNIELSPAPFPFRQRWDPQQQAFSFSKRNKRGGQSKREGRNQAHYYNDDNRVSKKRKRKVSCDIGGEWADGTDERQDEATNRDDVMLNYDDVESQDHDHSNNPVNETTQTTDLDDLPSLPEDVSVLPVLRPGEARVGMVITWQKWSCSSATSWQPQLSRVTAIVAAVDDNATALDVCLAKRDRYLDGHEKRYDHTTGQRIYGKFEAPDLDEETDGDHDSGGVDDGYRNIAWAEMQDPRVLQEPLDKPVEFDPNSTCLTSIETDEENLDVQNQAMPSEPTVPSPRELDAVADPVPTARNGHVGGSDSKPGASSKGKPGDCSVEPSDQAASNSTSHPTGRNQHPTDLMSDVSQVSSPSRQLHETTSQAMGSHSPNRTCVRMSSVEQTRSPPPNNSSPTHSPATASPHSYLDEDFENGLVTGTPEIVLLPAALPSLASSIRSGRQPDYAMGVDDGVSDPFEATDEIDYREDSNRRNGISSGRNSPTPVPTRQTATPDDNVNDRGAGLGPSTATTPTPRSPSSPSSVFCTAMTSHSTQSASRAQMSSAEPKPSTPKFALDERYEEAMRKLDEQLSNDSSDLSDADSLPPLLPTSTSPRVKREDSTQFPRGARDSISPPPKRKPSVPDGRVAPIQPTLGDTSYERGRSRSLSPVPRRRRSSRPFSIPPGSQVIQLSSDSESVYTEHYADDEIDGTYSPELGSMPNGGGWVKKRGRKKVRRSVA